LLDKADEQPGDVLYRIEDSHGNPVNPELLEILGTTAKTGTSQGNLKQVPTHIRLVELKLYQTPMPKIIETVQLIARIEAEQIKKEEGLPA
jgi:hypothetical protein